MTSLESRHGPAPADGDARPRSQDGGLRALGRLTVGAFVRGDDLAERQRDGGAQVRLLGLLVLIGHAGRLCLPRRDARAVSVHVRAAVVPVRLVLALQRLLRTVPHGPHVPCARRHQHGLLAGHASVHDVPHDRSVGRRADPDLCRVRRRSRGAAVARRDRPRGVAATAPGLRGSSARSRTQCCSWSIEPISRCWSSPSSPPSSGSTTGAARAGPSCPSHWPSPPSTTPSCCCSS